MEQRLTLEAWQLPRLVREVKWVGVVQNQLIIHLREVSHRRSYLICHTHLTSPATVLVRVYARSKVVYKLGLFLCGH